MPAKRRKTKKTWSERCRDPRWQKLRAARLNTDNWRCRECGSEAKTLNVHHRFYRYGSDPWDYEEDCLVTLCEDCHRLTEESLQEIRERAGMGMLCDQHKILEFLRQMRYEGAPPESTTPPVTEGTPYKIPDDGFAVLRAMMGRS